MGDDQWAPAEIQEHLQGVEYPVQKGDLILHAQNGGAPAEILALLQKLPEREYRTPLDVSMSLTRIN